MNILLAYHFSSWQKAQYFPERYFKASGRFLITDRIENGLPDLFEDGKHLVLYRNEKELVDKVSYYLSHEVLAKHTFYHRAQTIIDQIQKKMGFLYP
jgi:spore maturation protein CgeB